MKKKTLLGTSLSFIVTLALMLAFGGMTVFADDEQPSGTCGTDLVWELDTSGTLTISGEGDMDDYGDPDETPWNAYKGSITKVIIEDGVKKIGDYAFFGCWKLESLNIQGGVEVIGWGAFDTCEALKEVVLPQSLTTIGGEAFAHCSIKSIELPENLTSIGDAAFAHGRFKSIVIPGKVSYIGGYAFVTSDLESVTIPESVKTIGMNAFFCCNSLTSVYCYTDPSSIDAKAFDTDNDNIKLYVKKDYIQDYQRKFPGITVDDVLDSGTCGTHLKWKLDTSGTLTISGEGNMDDYGLGDAPWHAWSEDIVTVIIGDDVTSIGQSAFYDCEKLESITIPSGVTEIKADAFAYCFSLKSIVLPENLTAISVCAFEQSCFESIVIPEKVSSIEEFAFGDCESLLTVTIPESVSYIGEYVFSGCSKLSDVYCYADPGSIDVSAFDTGRSNIKLYVKKEYLQQYQSKFSSIDGIEFVSIVDMDLGVHLYGYTVSLDGAIGVNFSMRLSDELLASDTAKMVFTVTSLDETNTRTVEIPVSSLVEGKTKTGNDCFFKCNVVAKEMTSTITAQMVDGDQEGKVYTYSVQKYAQYIIENPSKFPVESVGIVKAMLNYGACAQTYFGYNTEKLANSILSADEQVIPDVSASMIEVDALNAKGSTVPSKVSLSLESTVTLKLSFETALLPEDVEFYDENGGILTTEISGEYTVVLIKGIPVQDLDKPVKISVSDGSEIAYCPLRYCRAVLANTSNPAYTADLKKLVAALYLYNESTKYGN